MADPKEAAARRVQELIRPGMVVGLGSGSTAAMAIHLLGQRVRQGLEIRAIPTSEASARLAAGYGVPLTDLEEVCALDLTFDGADEVDPELNLVKGLGGAALREKVVAAQTRCFNATRASPAVRRSSSSARASSSRRRYSTGS